MRLALYKKPILLAALFGLLNLTFLGHLDWWPFQICAFITLIVVPGVLLSYLLELPKDILWIARLGFGLICIMATGLLVNTLFPLLGVHEPLRTQVLTPVFDSVVLILAFLVARKSKQVTKPDSVKIKLSAKQILLLAMYALLPVVVSGGAMVLNNGGSNILSMVGFALIAISVCLTLTINTNKTLLYSISLYSIGLSVLLAYALRSNYVLGWDIQSELHVFTSTVAHKLWSPGVNDAYGATLSLTILPAIIKEMTGIGSTEILKVCYPVMTASMVPTVFLIAKKYVDTKYAYLIAFFFTAQSQYMQELPGLARQQIAFFFFFLLVYFLASKSTSSWRRGKVLIIILGLAVIVSHYSTGYVMVTVLALGYLVNVILNKLHGTERSSYPSALIIILFACFTMLWYGQITQSPGNIKGAVSSTISHLVSLNYDDQRSGTANQALFNTSVSNNSLVSQYNLSLISSASKDTTNLHQQTSYVPASSKQVNIKDATLNRLSGIYSEIVKKFIKVGLFIGVVAWLYQLWHKKKHAKDSSLAYSLAAGFLILTIMIALLPSISLFYNFERLYQQGLPLLGIMIVIGILFMLRILRLTRFGIPILCILFVSYFLNYSGVLSQVVGGNPTVTFANYGSEYDQFYRHKGETVAYTWLLSNKDSGTVYADTYSGVKLRSYGPDFRVDNNILASLDNNKDLFLSAANVQQGILYERFQDVPISLVYPYGPVQSDKSLIYTNNTSQIYR